MKVYDIRLPGFQMVFKETILAPGSAALPPPPAPAPARRPRRRRRRSLSRWRQRCSQHRRSRIMTRQARADLGAPGAQ